MRLVEDHELIEAGVPDIGRVLEAHGVELLRFPIVDMTVPPDRGALRLVLDDVRRRIDRGERVVVACRGGLGRTGTLTGRWLRDAGLDAQEAIKLTRNSRLGTIQTAAQEVFVAGWEPSPDAAPPSPITMPAMARPAADTP